MDDDRAWDRIVDAIDIKFGIIKHGRETRPLEDAQNLTEHVSFIVFDREDERYRMERISSPAIVDRRQVGSRRIGGETHMQNSYDEHEVARKTVLLREEGDEWVPINPDSLQL